MGKRFGLERVIIEGDDKIVMDVIRNRTSAYSVFGDYIRAIIGLITSLISIEIHFVKS